jgi:hypothetical protein
VRREAGAQPRDEKIERMGECGAIDAPVFSDRRGMTARGVGQVGDFQQGRFDADQNFVFGFGLGHGSY